MHGQFMLTVGSCSTMPIPLLKVLGSHLVDILATYLAAATEQIKCIRMSSSYFNCSDSTYNYTFNTVLQFTVQGE